MIPPYIDIEDVGDANMKRYIKSTTTLKQGSYVVDRAGNIHDIGMHVPSTTYLTRGLMHLASTDAEFLLNENLIDEKSALAILLYCYEEFLKNELGIDDENKIINLVAETQFVNYAELRHAPNVRKLFFNNRYRTISEIEDARSYLPDFDSLNDKWYKYLQDNYVKISRYGNTIEFRISSNDGFDWNNVIIDKVILKYDSGKPYTTRYSIARESDKGYQEYFYNATLNDILENDKAVLSSEYVDRKVVNGQLRYTKKVTSASREIVDQDDYLINWCKHLPSRIHTLYLHYNDGRIIGKFSIEDAIESYGDNIVTNAYSDGDGQVSVWILK